jgi:hypothetical protein
MASRVQRPCPEGFAIAKALGRLSGCTLSLAGCCQKAQAPPVLCFQNRAWGERRLDVVEFAELVAVVEADAVRILRQVIEVKRLELVANSRPEFTFDNIPLSKLTCRAVYP